MEENKPTNKIGSRTIANIINRELKEETVLDKNEKIIPLQNPQ